MFSLLKHPAAFRPFFTSRATLYVGGAGDGGADAVMVPCAVAAANMAGQMVGAAATAERWTVSFWNRDYRGVNALRRGMEVAADPDGRWPRLTVQNVVRLGGIVHLECSAKERGTR